MTVFLVGAGPGDPELLTRRGAALLARADVVVYDRLIDRAVLSLAPHSAELVDVGKRPAGADDGAVSGGAARQGEINELLVSYGRQGGTVVRLKGGDPFLFGRGGEEAEALLRAGVPWEVVPGVTSAMAVPARAGIPVTHRGLSTSVTVVTGHVGDRTAPGGVDWEALARSGGTLVVMMGMATRAEITRRLQAGGRSADTPVAVIEWGATPRQRTARSTLGRLADVDLGSPAVIVVGAVAGLDLEEVHRGPLRGRTVAVTRARGQASGLSAALAAAGARVLEVPVLAIEEPNDKGLALRESARRVAEYDWIAFGSANAVHRFMALLRDGRDLAGARLAVVGSATAAALASYNLVADLVPERATAEDLAAAIPESPAGGRALVPRAAAGREALAAGLRARRWDVDEVVAYRTVAAPPPHAEVAELLGDADAVVFASPSAVSHFATLRDTAGRPLHLPRHVVCIGPTTAGSALDMGMSGVIESDAPSDSGIVAALDAVLAGRPLAPGAAPKEAPALEASERVRAAGAIEGTNDPPVG